MRPPSERAVARHEARRPRGAWAAEELSTRIFRQTLVYELGNGELRGFVGNFEGRECSKTQRYGRFLRTGQVLVAFSFTKPQVNRLMCLPGTLV